MTPRGVRWLAIVASLALLAALYVSLGERAPRDSVAGTRLYPTLEAALNDVQSVRIHTAEDTVAVSIDKTATGWRVTERGGYPADRARVRKLLLGIAQAKLLEQKTSVVDNYPTLGVEDVSTEGATGHRIELAGGAAPVSLIVGKRPDALSTYVRRAGEAPSWQIDVALDVDGDPKSWLDRDLIDLKAERIQAAEVQHAGGPTWSIAKADAKATEYEVGGVPRGRELTSSAAGADLAAALAALRFDDVHANSGAMVPAATATFRTFDGLTVTCRGHRDGDRHLVRLEAVASDGATEAVRTEAASLNARAATHVFEVPGYTYDAIFRPLDSLLKK